MSSTAPEPLTTTIMMPDGAPTEASALLATSSISSTATTATLTAAIITATTTRNEEETPPPPPPASVEHKSRYFLRRNRHQSPTHTMLAAAVVAAVASVAVTCRSNQRTTPMSAAAVAAAAHSLAFTAADSTPSQQLFRRSKRKAVVNPVTPEEESSSSSFSILSTPQSKKPKSAAAATAARQKSNKKNALLPLPSLRTESFPALTPKNCFPFSSPSSSSLQHQQPVIPHTLILGTHPSIKSLQQVEYYSHSQNAFWWIAGDCLGFRRDTGISASTGKPFALTSALRYDENYILTYAQQKERLIQAGFVLWDVVASCERLHVGNNKGSKKKGVAVRMSSMDSDIKNEVPNDIRSFCTLQYPTIRRIVFANGQTGSSLFCKHNKEWLASGELCAGADELSQRHLAKACSSNRSSSSGGKNPETADDNDEELVLDGKGRIELIAAISVSPAAAKFSYQQKRDWWGKNVYQPGLREHNEQRVLL